MGDHPSELFSTGRIRFAGQSIGVVVAETPDAALKAAKSVKVTYKNAKKPVLTIREALKEPGRVTRDSCGPERTVGDIDPFDENIGTSSMPTLI